MKTKINQRNPLKILYLLIMTCGLLFIGCKKQGPPGKDGVDGTSGKDGNTNIISSSTITLNNWSVSFDDGTDFEYKSLMTWSVITQDIVTYGLIFVYYTDGVDWYQLPYNDSGTGYSTNLLFSISIGKINLKATGFDEAGSPGISEFNGLVVRVVVIPPAMIKPNVNYKNYLEVKTAHNLID